MPKQSRGARERVQFAAQVPMIGEMALELDHTAPASPTSDTGSRRDGRARAGLSRWGNWRKAGFFRRQEIGAANAERVAIEEFNRGVTLAAVGDTDGAVDAYRRAVRSAPGQLAAKAAFNIAVLRGADLLQAAAAYRVAIDSGDEDVAPKAAFNLGLLLEQDGDLVGAEHAFRRAFASGHGHVTQKAALKLAHLAAPAGAVTPPTPARASAPLQRHRTRRRGATNAGWPATPNRHSRIRRARGHAG